MDVRWRNLLVLAVLVVLAILAYYFVLPALRPASQSLSRTKQASADYTSLEGAWQSAGIQADKPQSDFNALMNYSDKSLEDAKQAMLAASYSKTSGGYSVLARYYARLFSAAAEARQVESLGNVLSTSDCNSLQDYKQYNAVFAGFVSDINSVAVSANELLASYPELSSVAGVAQPDVSYKSNQDKVAEQQQLYTYLVSVCGKVNQYG